MNIRMMPMPIEQLAEWIFREYKESGTVFGVHHSYHSKEGNERTFLGRKLETPIGPAAGPHTQLAQNLIASYYAGGRFFELKTVQELDGLSLSDCVPKPCIEAADEGYNVEWSTELYVEEARNEYIKAWFMMHIMAKELDLGSMDGFQFSMSVGYDLKGIQTKKMDDFIESLKDASETEEFKHCCQYFLHHITDFEHITKEDVERISPYISNSITLSTLHGCPAEEIEEIAVYLMRVKGLHTFIKCNPTLLGYEFVRKTMDDMGYGYLSFDSYHFLHDLQYDTAISMLQRLMDVGISQNVEFGIKLTNTFPVRIKHGELPGNEMYMSGKPLFILAYTLAGRIADELKGKILISFSGGVDRYNIKELITLGIYPVTVATTLLKPGGYERLTQLAKVAEILPKTKREIDAQEMICTAELIRTNPYYRKNKQKGPFKKIHRTAPLFDCFIAPCEQECPIHQEVTAYMELVKQKKYKEALEIITKSNPLPFITGTICYHYCMNQCMRNYYESPIEIREAKLKAAQYGMQELIASIQPVPLSFEEKVGIIGGGPAGLSAAYFIARGGMKATVFEQREQLGGAVRFAVPSSEICEEVIDRDIEFIKTVCPYVEFEMCTKVEDIQSLKAKGYSYIIIATGVYRMEAPLKRQESIFSHINQPEVYRIGDLLQGPSSVVESIRDASLVAEEILLRNRKQQKRKAEKAEKFVKTVKSVKEMTDIYDKRGVLETRNIHQDADNRCLHCADICEVCAEVCPNRANIVIAVPGMEQHQIIHVDRMCNGCGNCKSFCPYEGAPYLDKFTLFDCEEDMNQSENDGFMIHNWNSQSYKVRYHKETMLWSKKEIEENLPKEIAAVIDIVSTTYSYLLKKDERV
ncbi:MAG: NAD(P)-binding protein [Lachnospiraceae bacterium]